MAIKSATTVGIDFFIFIWELLLLCPGLGLIEHGDIATNLQLIAVKPDGTLVGLTVLGVVDFTTFPLVAFLGKPREDVHTNELSALQLLVRIVHIELSVAFFSQTIFPFSLSPLW